MVLLVVFASSYHKYHQNNETTTKIPPKTPFYHQIPPTTIILPPNTITCRICCFQVYGEQLRSLQAEMDKVDGLVGVHWGSLRGLKLTKIYVVICCLGWFLVVFSGIYDANFI